ncbi:hypothetical protein HK096_010105, partial [Nowakowskiella sp. JEL0078]
MSQSMPSSINLNMGSYTDDNLLKPYKTNIQDIPSPVTLSPQEMISPMSNKELPALRSRLSKIKVLCCGVSCNLLLLIVIVAVAAAIMTGVVIGTAIAITSSTNGGPQSLATSTFRAQETGIVGSPGSFPTATATVSLSLSPSPRLSFLPSPSPSPSLLPSSGITSCNKDPTKFNVFGQTILTTVSGIPGRCIAKGATMKQCDMMQLPDGKYTLAIQQD